MLLFVLLVILLLVVGGGGVSACELPTGETVTPPLVGYEGYLCEECSYMGTYLFGGCICLLPSMDPENKCLIPNLQNRTSYFNFSYFEAQVECPTHFEKPPFPENLYYLNNGLLGEVYGWGGPPRICSQCEPGWGPPPQEVTSGACQERWLDSECNGKGKWDPKLEQCECLPGRTGLLCDQCQLGWGPPGECQGSWTPDPIDGQQKLCGGHGQVWDGQCVCDQSEPQGFWQLMNYTSPAEGGWWRMTCAACLDLSDPFETQCLQTFGPTPLPTHSPSVTKKPTFGPTLNPTKGPSLNPTLNPTQNPTTLVPTKGPTLNPTLDPTRNPTKNPTFNPTKNPTKNPTSNPTLNPTLNPTKNPTKNPTTKLPTKNPTLGPTKNPTRNPTKNPTLGPTKNPTTKLPTKNPTQPPTLNPTKNPTTKLPTLNPTLGPTKNPTKNPTLGPTKNPTRNPTKNPTLNPTRNPTQSPTKLPTQSPTPAPVTLVTLYNDGVLRTGSSLGSRSSTTSLCLLMSQKPPVCRYTPMFLSYSYLPLSQWPSEFQFQSPAIQVEVQKSPTPTPFGPWSNLFTPTPLPTTLLLAGLQTSSPTINRWWSGSDLLGSVHPIDGNCGDFLLPNVTGRAGSLILSDSNWITTISRNCNSHVINVICACLN
jgi:hypothetical protein